MVSSTLQNCSNPDTPEDLKAANLKVLPKKIPIKILSCSE